MRSWKENTDIFYVIDIRLKPALFGTQPSVYGGRTADKYVFKERRSKPTQLVWDYKVRTERAQQAKGNITTPPRTDHNRKSRIL